MQYICNIRIILNVYFFKGLNISLTCKYKKSSIKSTKKIMILTFFGIPSVNHGSEKKETPLGEINNP